MTLLALAAALTVANVVRLAAHARRDEIEIMQLVGAPLAYVRGPFVPRACSRAAAARLFALLALWILFLVGRARYGQVVVRGPRPGVVYHSCRFSSGCCWSPAACCSAASAA